MLDISSELPDGGDGLPDSPDPRQMIFSAIFRVPVPGGRIQIADVTIQVPVSEEGKRNIDLWTG